MIHSHSVRHVFLVILISLISATYGYAGNNDPASEPSLVYPSWTGYPLSEIQGYGDTGAVITTQNHIIKVTADAEQAKRYPLADGTNPLSSAVGSEGRFYVVLEDADSQAYTLKEGYNGELTAITAPADSIEKIWFERDSLYALSGPEVYQYDQAKDNWTARTNTGQQLPFEDVTIEGDQNLWGITNQSEVFRYSEEENAWQHYVDLDPEFMRGADTFEIAQHADTLWAIAEHQLFAIDPADSSQELVSENSFTSLVRHETRDELIAGEEVMNWSGNRTLKVHDGDGWYIPDGYQRGDISYTIPVPFDNDNWALFSREIGEFQVQPESGMDFRQFVLLRDNQIDTEDSVSRSVLPIMTHMGAHQLQIGPENELWITSLYDNVIPMPPYPGVTARLSADGWELIPQLIHTGTKVRVDQSDQVYFNSARSLHKINADSLTQWADVDRSIFYGDNREGPFITDFLFDENNHIWYMAGNLFHFDTDQNDFREYEIFEEGISIDRSLVLDRVDFNFWIGHETKITRFDPHEGKVVEDWEPDGSRVLKVAMIDNTPTAVTRQGVYRMEYGEWNKIYSSETSEDENSSIHEVSFVDAGNFYALHEINGGVFMVKKHFEEESNTFISAFSTSETFIEPAIAADHGGDLWLSDGYVISYYGDPENIGGHFYDVDRRVVSTEPVSKSDIPSEIVLHDNYPNPFNPKTTISWELPDAAEVSLEVYDIQGRRITTLVDQKYLQSGKHQTTFDGSGFSSGGYVYRLLVGDQVKLGVMMLIK